MIKSKNFTESIPKESVTDWSKDNNVITDQELVLNLTENGISYMLKRVLKQGKIALTEIHKFEAQRCAIIKNYTSILDK